MAGVREALKAQGFGVLTEIDVQATLRDKLGQEMEQYLTLGACNPPLAHRALSADRRIGLPQPEHGGPQARETARGRVRPASAVHGPQAVVRERPGAHRYIRLPCRRPWRSGPRVSHLGDW